MSSSIINRCFAILEALADSREGQSLGTLAERTGMPKSAVHRMLAALLEAGYAVQLPSRDYKLTLKLPGLGLRYLSNTDLLKECQPVLDGLARDLGELVRLALVEAESLVWIGKAQGARSGLLVDPVMGHQVVLHATATGKVWLSSLSTEDALRIVFRHGFGTNDPNILQGPKVKTTVEELQAELKATAARGYGLAEEEAEPGISALAVPIRGRDGQTVVGTLSIAGPSARLTHKQLLACLPQLRHASSQLTGLDVLRDLTP
ncbi:MAG: IclR family transcriptional regulator [Rhizobiaceae bacterium]|nr:IclR family transcriptional regulator [Rhizobiaceae bacterium]